MKTTIEEINGKLCTVIRGPLSVDDVVNYKEAGGHPSMGWCGSGSLTVLPALPKRPTPEDARLLYRYMAEGIVLTFTQRQHQCGYDERRITLWELERLWKMNKIGTWQTEITLAINSETGERVEVAIV